jgi:hypothetical protein
MTHYLRLTPLAVALLLLTAFVQTPKPEPGFTSLFNGRDFTDWKLQNPGSFAIQDGAIVANGANGYGHAFYDGPFRNHAFQNFELRVDVMARANSNGGIYVLTEFQEKGFPGKGFEIQVNNTYGADKVKTGSLYHVSDVYEALPKDDEWFTETITVQGMTITVKVNDKQTVQWTQPADWKGSMRANGTVEFAGRRIGTPGTIALQAHDPKSTVFYRNLRIRPLD